MFTALLLDDLFPVIGMRPELGRGFTREALAPKGPPAAYGVKPSDPLTIVAVTLTLAAVALSAAWAPAWRAGRVDPIVALRYE